MPLSEPREVRAWACAFRCGQKCDTQRNRMIAHQGNCNWNPAVRACPTCRHDEHDQDDGQYYCAVEAKPAALQILSGCPVWEDKCQP